jgi:hypothetical protein
MSPIRGRNTGIEVQLRKGLHRLGLRYRLDGAGLPGRPDIVLPKYRTVAFVHGCFWHGHTCPLYRESRRESKTGHAQGGRVARGWMEGGNDLGMPDPREEARDHRYTDQAISTKDFQ